MIVSELIQLLGKEKQDRPLSGTLFVMPTDAEREEYKQNGWTAIACRTIEVGSIYTVQRADFVVS